jgi:hypothetical protein
MKKIRVLIIFICTYLSQVEAKGLHPVINGWTQKWGYANDKGDTIIPAIYQIAGPFRDGIAAVGIFGSHPDTSNWSAYINEKNQVVIKLDYTIWLDSTELSCFHEGKAAFHNRDFSWGFINKKGEVIIKPQFDRVGIFQEGVAFAAILNISWPIETIEHPVNHVGYINDNGNWVFKLGTEFTDLYGGCYYSGGPFSNGEARMSIVEKNFDCDHGDIIMIDKKGIILRHLSK